MGAPGAKRDAARWRAFTLRTPRTSLEREAEPFSSTRDGTAELGEQGADSWSKNNQAGDREHRHQRNDEAVLHEALCSFTSNAKHVIEFSERIALAQAARTRPVVRCHIVASKRVIEDVDQNEWLANRFEEQRSHLRSVAYRMLGSLAEADDAVQDTWVRVSRAGTGDVDNLGGWLTTVLARVCLNMLRSRNTRREQELEEHLPDPLVSPEEQALLADSVGLALLVVLDTLSPAERLAFVLHDMFELPFEDIAPMIDRSPAAARQLASRARRRVKGADIREPDSDIARQRMVVDAFFQAARGGDLEGLVAVLHPDVVLRGEMFGRPPVVVRGAAAVAAQARLGAMPAAELHPVLVNGTAGVVVTLHGRPYAVMAFTVVESRIVEIDAIADPARVARLAADLVG